ncbi:hypothetical protein [Flavobacterium piscis]|uniref:General stress protein CsbA n=1 Tax=Flavobacterium piscis TaxID=1114874 RepID=A0ABU1YBI3_9FLAO|nr:hypothetical protein [Flavobacterium piscis]MDR7211513.1 general stress protein CsbA [Flavobacterium piscis]
METAFILSSALLIAYSVLALFDGVFLHLYKYRLHEQKESKFEHLTHTIRAVLFSCILYSLFIRIENNSMFFIAMTLVFLDIITLMADAYVEKDSRKFMGGLPRWEYIIHLLLNGFHFASITVFLVIKIHLTNDSMVLQNSFEQFENYTLFKIIALNLLPGSILTGLLHILVYIPKFNFYFKKLQFKCC